jgi:IstB-like ATP binding protein
MATPDGMWRVEVLRTRSGEIFQIHRRAVIGMYGGAGWAPTGWTKTFTDPRLCAAIVDRLTFAGQIVETGTVSYRLAHARAAHKH